MARTAPRRVARYTVLSVKDASHGIPGSDAIVARRVYRILVRPEATRDDVQAVIKDVQSKAASGNPDIDEIVVFVYDRKGDASGAYTRGRGEWGVGGTIGDVTEDVARSNDRSRYSLSVDARAPLSRKRVAKGAKPYDLNSNEVTPFEEKVSADMSRALEEYTTEDGDDTIAVRHVARKYGLPDDVVRKIDAKVTGARLGMPWR